MSFVANPMKIFENISTSDLPKNTFPKTHPVCMTFNPGELAPCFVMQMAPGETVKLGNINHTKFPALAAPAMFAGKMAVNYFAVTLRTLWESFDEWYQGESGYTIPTLRVETGLTAAQYRMLDMFGIPPIDDSTAKEHIDITAWAFSAYNKVYNDYYRPRTFEDEVPYKLPAAGGDIGTTLRTELLNTRLKCYIHDYHTSMLSEPMVAPEVSLSISIGVADDWSTKGTPKFLQNGGLPTADGAALQSGGILQINTTSIPPLQPAVYDPDNTLEGTALINALRKSQAQQKYLEKIGRAGGEYYEIIMATYGVRIPDGRLQRAEYITGSKSPININPVITTANTGADAAEKQGYQTGNAYVYGGDEGDYYTAKEHSIVIGIASFTPDPMYSQGIERHYRAFTKDDYIIPEFAHLGEQAILSSEITAYEEPQGALSTIGYLPNYTHHKVMQPRIAGLFRDELSSWVVVKKYDTTSGIPTLDKDFLQVQPDCMDNVFAVNSALTDNIWFNILHVVEHTMALPVYSDPI